MLDPRAKEITKVVALACAHGHAHRCSRGTRTLQINWTAVNATYCTTPGVEERRGCNDVHDRMHSC